MIMSYRNNLSTTKGCHKSGCLTKKNPMVNTVEEERRFLEGQAIARGGGRNLGFLFQILLPRSGKMHWKGIVVGNYFYYDESPHFLLSISQTSVIPPSPVPPEPSFEAKGSELFVSAFSSWLWCGGRGWQPAKTGQWVTCFLILQLLAIVSPRPKKMTPLHHPISLKERIFLLGIHRAGDPRTICNVVHGRRKACRGTKIWSDLGFSIRFFLPGEARNTTSLDIWKLRMIPPPHPLNNFS